MADRSGSVILEAFRRRFTERDGGAMSDYGDLLRGTKPGLYAVSAQIVAHARDPGPGHGDWLLRSKPIAVVGHTYYIYDLQPFASGVVGAPGR